MATVGNTFPTMLDIAKRMDPDGGIANIVESMVKYNPILEDIAWQEGNLPTGHRYTSRTALPSLSWRRFNQGVPRSKSITEQNDETVGMLEGFSQVDEDLADLNGNNVAFRASEDTAFLQSMNLEVATGLFYHSVVNTPEKFQGLTPRFNATAGNPAAGQIIKADAAASGADQTSIWLVGWSSNTVFGIFPKGSRAGLRQEDLGKQLVQDGAGNNYVAYTTKWQWKMGLVVRDWRYLVRICNIDTSNIKADLSTGADLVLSMLDAYAAVFEMNTVNPVYYMNRATYSMLNKQLVKKGTANLLEYIDRGGRRIPSFYGIPIRIVDAVTNNESVVV
jgi:hypothetical protein